ncbi:hypothetical protein [Erythrobacter sp. YT30]|uniref:hypothetical protein n=1 Tax=Erythrobacter sp. YT30 TaxID=1735012 RepID=UPI00076D4DE6|nr:hypothetical protein [Erythrobacter sp. YT30]KWV91824.1 hypothetical protein AUC45_11560 [Erythrobacter sp. YT30]
MEMDDIAKARAAAKEHADYHQEIADFYREQGASLDKWLLATELSVCGGAIIALLNAEGVNDVSRFYAAAWFFGGLIWSIGIGGLRVKSTYDSALLHLKAARAFTRFSKNGAQRELDSTFDDEPDTVPSFAEKTQLLLRPVPVVCIIVGALITLEGFQ